MIVLEARIDINNTADIGTIDSVHETNARVQSNISSGEPIKDGSGNVTAIDLASVLNNIKPSINPYRLNYSVLDSGALFWDEKSFYIGGVLSASVQSADGSYEFGTPYKFEIETASGIAFFGIMFDSLNRNYPTEIIVDGVPYANNSGIFYAFNLDKAVKKHTIEISKFSTPYALLQIQGVFSDIEIVVDNRNGLSIDIDIDDREDNKKPSFGVISNGGSLSFIDSRGVVKNLIDSYMLGDKNRIDIVMKNSAYNKEYKVGTFYFSTLNYDIEDNVVSIDFVDDMVMLQDILTQNMPFKFNAKMYDVFVFLSNKMPERYKTKNSMFYEHNIPENVLDTLKDTVCKYAYLNTDNMFANWNKLCTVCGLYIYKDHNGDMSITADNK